VRRDHPGTALCAAIVVVLSLVLAASPADARKPQLPLEHVRDVRLPGSPSRFDYQDVDPSRDRLFIAHLGANQVDVVDLPTLQVAGVVHAIPEVHGVRAAPDLGITYASATSTDAVIAIDASALTIRFDAPTGDFPDGLAYDPDDGTAFVSNKNAGSVTSFDAQTGQQIRTVKLGDETGNVTYDPGSHAVFAAARTPDQLVSLDPRTGDITTRIDLPGCKGAHGLYLEPSARLAFVACERNARLSVVDLTGLKQVSTNSVGKDPDVLAYDAELRRLYVGSESGIVAVFELRRSSLVKLGQSKLANRAHSVAVDPGTHRVFFPLENVHGRPVLRVMRPTRI
jgi:DNA-binding beta-propeller fold protein YncE